MEQTENALKELEKLAGKYPAQAKYQALIGDFYLETDELDKALMHYEKAQELEPQSPFYIVSMTNYYEKTGDTEAATKEIESALKNPLLDFDMKLAILGRYAGNLLSDNKDAETANSLFQTLMEQHPQEKELNMIYGQFMLSQEKWEDARFQFQLVAEAEPENLLAWNLLLDIAVKEENTGEIIRICHSATVIFPDNVRFHFYKGMAHFQSKYYQEALNAFLEGINHIPAEDRQSLSMFYGQVGDLYHYLNQQDESFLAYEKALEYNENNISVLNNYAYFLSLAKEQLEKAERMSARTIRLQPNNSTFLDTYAWVFFQQGNYSLAKFYIESAISYGGNNNSVILEHYGDILFKTGNIDKAVEEWKKALETQEETENTALLEKKIKNRMYYESE
jgi:tetratricopeptide (TPR) repeat protein